MRRSNTFFSLVAIQLIATISGLSQTDVHRFASISVLPDRSISLELAGNAPVQFRPYFDLYVVEVSNNATDWMPLAALLRTNSANGPLRYVDSLPADQAVRFFRTPTNHQVTPFPRPTGPYAVGTTSLLLTDPSRSNRYSVATNRSFMMTLWFPATESAGVLLAPYIEQKLAPVLAALYGTGPSVLANFRSHARNSLSIARSDAPYPVVIYSHGFRVNRRDNTAKCEELASHGFVVAAVDHADCLGTVFPDGRLLASTISKLSAELFQSDVEDIRFVLEFLTLLNRDDLVFRGTMDLERVGTMGWSYGGGVAAEICRTDPRVKATVLLEAYLQNAHDVAWLGIQKPFLGMYNATSAFTTPFDQATRDAYWMRIDGTEHQHFADWLAWISSPAESSRRAAVAMNACLLSFFDKHLKSVDDHLLDDPAKAYPEIIHFSRK